MTHADLTRATSICIDGPLALRHHVRAIGQGPEIVVFGHGFGTDQHAWDQIVEAVPDRFTIVLFDLPGTGPLLPEGFDPDDYRQLSDFADDLLDLLEEMGVARCTFIGHSVAGAVGILSAIELPDRFDRLILLNASPRYLNDAGYAGGFDPSEIAALLDSMAANYQAWVAGFAPAAIGEDVPRAVEQFSTTLLAMRPDVTVRVARTIFESDIRALLPHLRVPTVLIHSRRDIAVSPQAACYLHSKIDGSRLVWIEADGHLPHLSSPALVRGAVRDALA